MAPKISLKGRLAKAFLNFLDEHGDYRTQLEEAAARAAAAEANSLLAKDRWGRKKKKRKGGRGKLKDGEYDEDGEYDDQEDEWDDDYEELPDPTTTSQTKKNQLPDDPYEQIQFYFHTFQQRTTLQIQERLNAIQTSTKEWVHGELHHPKRVPILSGSMLLATLVLYGLRARGKKLGGVVRMHGILGKKLQLSDYLHSNLFRGRILLHFSIEGRKALDKMSDKAEKAESAALASMRPYQRKRYERLATMERMWEKCVTLCLVLGIVCSGGTLILSLDGLVRGVSYTNSLNENAILDGEQQQLLLDGHIYSLDGPTDSDGYPVGMREMAEENYAACLLEAEEHGVEDPRTVCDVNSFFDKAASDFDALGKNNARETERQEQEQVPTSSSQLRTQIHEFLTSKLHVPSPLSTYLTTLHSQTIAYLSSLLTFCLFLITHYISHKLHLSTLQNDPMKHFVLSATDKSVKADGTVEAKRGETEAQRKRRERMLQNERLKAQMAQLAMEAKQRVEERRKRIEGAEAVEREKEEQVKKEVEEQEEIVKVHGRQYMMIKAGVPEGAIMNSLIAEGVDDESERLEIVEKLRAIKVRRAEEARRQEEEELKKVEEEKKAEEEKERIAQERLRMMKRQGSSFKASSRSLGSRTASSASLGNKLGGGKKSAKANAAAHSGGGGASVTSQASGNGNGGGSSIASASTITSAATSTNNDPSVAKSNMLSQIGGQNNLLKSTKLRKLPTKIASTPAVRPGSAMIVSGNMPVGAKSDKRWDRESKTWVNAVIIKADEEGNNVGVENRTPNKSGGTPKKSNMTENNNNGVNPNDATPVRRIPSRLKMKHPKEEEEEEEKKGEDVPDAALSGSGRIKPRLSSSKALPPPAMPSPISTTASSSPATAAAAEVNTPTKKKKHASLLKKQVSELTSPPSGENDGNNNDTTANNDNADNNNDTNSESSPELVLVRISSSPEIDGVNIIGNSSSSGELQLPSVLQTPNNPSSEDAWGRRMSVKDIQATITAVENAPEENDDNNDNNQDGEGEENTAEGGGVDLAPAWLHSPAFEMALRNSNANWDRRPSSRDVMARIRAVELAEASGEEEGTGEELATGVQQTEGKNGTATGEQPTELTRSHSGLHKIGEHSPAVIHEKQQPTRSRIIEPTTSFEFRRKASKNNTGNDSDNDDEISELSEPTYHSLEQNAFKGRSIIPQALFVPNQQQQDASLAALSPMVSSVNLTASGSSGGRKNLVVGANMERLMKKVEKGELEFPAVPNIEEDGNNNSKKINDDETKEAEEEEVVVEEETEEQIQRRKKAEARAKKMEAIAARREAGKEDVDDESSTTGMKRHRLRRKKKKAAQQMEAQQEEASVKSDAQKSDAGSNATPKVETEDEKQRRMRAEARAKKMEAIAARREAGREDDTTVSGISRRHRLRRKKSALAAAALSPEEQARIDWKNNIYSSVLNAEKVQWRRTIYGHVLNAEATHKSNTEAKRKLDEQNAAAKRRIEHQKKLDKKAKKFAARAERFHQIRRQESSGSVLGLDGGDDASSVVSSASRMRRKRRGRKSSSRNSLLQERPQDQQQEVQEQPLLEEPLSSSSVPVQQEVMTVEEKEEQQQRQQWCHKIYSNALHADQNRWKRKAYANALNAENARNNRLALEERIAEERAAAEARKEKERKDELRARKMERIKSNRESIRMVGGEGGGNGEKLASGATDDDDNMSVATSATASSGTSALKKMRNRRRKAAMKKASSNV